MPYAGGADVFKTTFGVVVVPVDDAAAHRAGHHALEDDRAGISALKAIEAATRAQVLRRQPSTKTPGATDTDH